MYKYFFLKKLTLSVCNKACFWSFNDHHQLWVSVQVQSSKFILHCKCCLSVIQWGWHVTVHSTESRVTNMWIFVNYRNQRKQKPKLIVQQNVQVVMELLATPWHVSSVSSHLHFMKCLEMVLLAMWEEENGQKIPIRRWTKWHQL